MNILIVTAHPSSKGFTHRIAETYQKEKTANGHLVEILNLYASENRQDYLTFEDIRTAPADPRRAQMQEKITWADEIVIIHPLWWFDAPAILKNWVDVNFTSGFAYKYTEKTKVVPLKLLKGKSGRVFITADGPRWLYWFVKPFKTSWCLGRLGYCGIKVKTFRIFAEKRTKTPEELEGWLGEVQEIARES